MPKEVPGLSARHRGLAEEADSFLGARGGDPSSLGPMSGASPPVLGSGRAWLGREREREALDRLLDGGRAGRGGALVVHGEPGLGKTALLEWTVETGREFRVASICGG